MRSRRLTHILAFAAGALATAVLVAVLASSQSDSSRSAEFDLAGATSVALEPGGAVSAVQTVASGRRTPVVVAAEHVMPSVVSVNVIRRQRIAPRSLFEEFVPEGFEREVAGLGSGFAIDADGHILTNAHVVQGATEVVVTTSDGTDHAARLMGLDELSDLALLKVDSRLPVPRFGDSDALVTGEPAIAIGSPFGYLLSNAEPTVTAGVISGVGRHILPSALGRQGQTIYADMIQTDASINPGNSGGALANAEGEVVGVNSAIFSRSGGSQGLGFAIPINRALRIAEQLRTRGEVRRPWVGLEVDFPSEEGAARRRGAVISKVTPGSPAADARLEGGLELVAVRGRAVKSPLDWEAELLTVTPGEQIEVTVREPRGNERRVQLNVEELPSVTAARVQPLEGLELVTLTEAIRAERSLRSEQGALIVGASAEVQSVTGMREGDVIVQINRWPVEKAGDVTDILEYMTERGGVQIYYERDQRYRRSTFRVAGGG